MLADRDDEPIITGHDIHFLRRLERVNLSESDLALRLYRDRSLVQAILADGAAAREVFRKPGDQPRVAIAIGSGESPPHLVVNHEGKFVTCLASGMSVDRAPVVPWERVRIHLRRADNEAKEWERAGGVLKATDGGRQLMTRVYRSGLHFSREEFEQAAAISPILLHKLPEMAGGIFVDLDDAGRRVARMRRIGPAEERYLRFYWQHYCSLGHLFMMWASGGRARFEHWSGVTDGVEPFSILFLPMVRAGFGPVAFRALFAIARAGKIALPPMKRALMESRDLLDYFAALLSVMAIGIRHQKLRAEVISCLAAARQSAQAQWGSRQDVVEVVEATVDFVGLAFEEGGLADHRAVGRPLVHELLARFDPDNRLGLRVTDGENPATDPRYDPLVVPILCSMQLDLSAGDHMRWFICGAICVATAEADELYLPARQAEILAARFSPEFVHRLAKPWAAGGPVVRREKKVGRNEPCRCGSGKKWKRCCGA